MVRKEREKAHPGSCSHYGEPAPTTGLARIRRYHPRATSSQVDESLFGNCHQKMAPTGQLALDSDPCSDRALAKAMQAVPGTTKAIESLRIITKDHVRDLIIPTEDPSGKTLIMSPMDFERIKAESRIVSEEERHAMRKAINAEKMQAAELVAIRKGFIRAKEMERKKNEKLTDVEEVARDRALYLLEKANSMRLEQEDEIRKINETIVGAKCHAIRDAQILEKEQIAKEMLDEDRRLDTMMEVDRQKALKMQDEIECKRKENGLRAKVHVIEQMEEKEKERILQQEVKALEARDRLQAMEQLHQEDLENLQEKQRKQVQTHQEIMAANKAVRRRREQLQEQDRIADQKVREFQDAKTKREAEYEELQKRLKREKAIEIARLQALQKRAHDVKAEQDELRAKRSQEAAEREWRRKELEDEQKKAKLNEELKKSRISQIQQKQHFLAVQATKERQEFERVLRVQKEQMAKEQQEEEDRRQGRTRYASDLRHQIREKEQKQIAEKATFFEEGRRLKEEAQQRRLRLDQIKRKKLQELRSVGLPEKYCHQIERRLEAISA
ncbi:cilia- and flagella-associated protein 45-like isoform X1 [Hypanus sabinus]|uniref:cilia- and flagella-associated protein 45-like isoform X1 n=1 Tax=Hypanus sabinus TaxID=79690 RepID=UPI0028C4797F|nr:cilia- and flagella-associated protein 45-like isoform X1 [Hypanus sabinus]